MGINLESDLRKIPGEQSCQWSEKRKKASIFLREDVEINGRTQDQRAVSIPSQKNAPGASEQLQDHCPRQVQVWWPEQH